NTTSYGTYNGGSTALIPAYPGTDPYTTSVGGTTNTSALNAYCTSSGSTSGQCPRGLPSEEVVWNDPYFWGSGYDNGLGGGGGISTYFAMPSWQSTSVPGVSNSYSNSTACESSSYNTSPGSDCREVPDVSADADGVTGYLVYEPDAPGSNAGGWQDWYGTSGAAPLWAAYTALIDDQCPSGQGVGFANP